MLRVCPACSNAVTDTDSSCASCGALVPEGAPPDPLRTRLAAALGAQYELKHLLGRGGMGAVYLARDPFLERDVAVKVLPPDRAGTGQSRERFLREARTAARLSHPNIVPLFTFGEVDDTLYYVMGYVRGESLSARLRRERRLPVDEARRVLMEVADALDHAHRLGVVHRDIKPDNVMLEEGTGRALLTDFGVAKALDAQTMTSEGSVVGTPSFMSPEQAQGRADVDGRSDLYSLGVMGYAMLAGRLPFEGATPGDVLLQHITKQAPPLATLAPELPPEVAVALTRCLAKEPAARWANGRSLRAALDPEEDPDFLEPGFAPVRTMVQLSLAFAFVLAHLQYGEWLVSGVPGRPEAGFGLRHLALIGTLMFPAVALGAAFEVKQKGHAWRTILHEAFRKPSWWFSWYPARLRVRGDAWQRLPMVLRQTRTSMGVVTFAGALIFPLMFQTLQADEVHQRHYARTARQTAFGTALTRFKNLPRPLPTALLVLPPIALLVPALFFIRRQERWKSEVVARGTDRSLVDRMLTMDTGWRGFWSRPEVAALLTGGSGDAAPSSPAEVMDALESMRSGASDVLRPAFEEAVQAVRGLKSALEALDREIAIMARDADPAEIARLEEKVSAFGPEVPGEPEDRRTMRALTGQQLTVLRGLATRLQAARERRGRHLEQLRRLGAMVDDLRRSGSDPARTGQLTERLRALSRQADVGGSTVAETRDNAVADMPTLER